MNSLKMIVPSAINGGWQTAKKLGGVADFIFMRLPNGKWDRIAVKTIRWAYLIQMISGLAVAAHEHYLSKTCQRSVCPRKRHMAEIEIRIKKAFNPFYYSIPFIGIIESIEQILGRYDVEMKLYRLRKSPEDGIQFVKNCIEMDPQAWYREYRSWQILDFFLSSNRSIIGSKYGDKTLIELALNSRINALERSDAFASTGGLGTPLLPYDLLINYLPADIRLNMAPTILRFLAHHHHLLLMNNCDIPSNHLFMPIRIINLLKGLERPQQKAILQETVSEVAQTLGQRIKEMLAQTKLTLAQSGDIYPHKHNAHYCILLIRQLAGIYQPHQIDFYEELQKAGYLSTRVIPLRDYKTDPAFLGDREEEIGLLKRTQAVLFIQDLLKTIPDPFHSCREMLRRLLQSRSPQYIADFESQHVSIYESMFFRIAHLLVSDETHDLSFLPKEIQSLISAAREKKLIEPVSNNEAAQTSLTNILSLETEEFLKWSSSDEKDPNLAALIKELNLIKAAMLTGQTMKGALGKCWSQIAAESSN